MIGWRNIQTRITFTSQGKGAHSHIGSESTYGLLRNYWFSGFDQFRVSLIWFLGQLNSSYGSTVKKYKELRQAIQEAKNKHPNIKRRITWNAEAFVHERNKM